MRQQTQSEPRITPLMVMVFGMAAYFVADWLRLFPVQKDATAGVLLPAMSREPRYSGGNESP